jgi:5-methylcytosine-specific restriction endonuclease McrA
MSQPPSDYYSWLRQNHPTIPPPFAALRQHVLNRDGGICRYCDAPATEVDHVYPKSKGGPDAEWNLVASCTLCNLIASDTVFPSFEAKRAHIWMTRYVRSYYY